MLAMGEPISSKQALEIASSYLVKSGAPRRAAAQMSVQPFQTDRQGNPLMYAVNNGGEGYAIVSGDDRMRQVLLYSNSGSLDLADMPANMRYWLQTLCADMQILIDAGYQPQAVESRRAAAEVKTEIRTMLPSHWGQDTPYNALCPKDGKSLSLTGCVATAMAQVIYYHYKVRKAAIPSQPLKDTKAYKGYRGIEVKALKAEDYIIDWSQLIDDYTAKGVTPTEAQKQNIAKLMYFCGAAVEMDYNSSVSLASDNMLSPALINYFGFSPATRLVNRASYTEQQWDDLIYKELKNGRPVLYGGSGSAGHQFVIDGYNGNELFHVNWGWNGFRDNYVALSVLNSEQSFPIGARESTAEFAGGQGAVINAEYGGTAKAADRLSVLITEELQDLQMPSSSFYVRFDTRPKERFFNSKGIDDITFMFSANPGQPPMDLASTASGGEASRIMLAIKNILSSIDMMPTLIFDEIDTGVSGLASLSISKKLKSISKQHQVLCVSHTAQLAAASDHNFLIRKNTDGTNTYTDIIPLNEEDKITEVSRLLSGNDDKESRDLAVKMIEELRA